MDYVNIQTRTEKAVLLQIIDAVIGILLVGAFLVVAGGVMMLLH